MRYLIRIGVLALMAFAVVACQSPDVPEVSEAEDQPVVETAAEPDSNTVEMAESVDAESENEMTEETEMAEKDDEAMAEETVEEVVDEGPTAAEVAQMERAAAGTIRDNDRAGNRDVEEDEAAEEEVRSLASFLPNLGEAPEVDNGEPWINSDPLTLEELEGKVVLIEFWTYS
ncbi:MAG: hypothetical protein AAGD96_17015 [Chloroflexota bacterium]